MRAALDAEGSAPDLYSNREALATLGLGQGRAAELLLDAGAAIDARDASGQTALMLAAERGLAGMASLLLERGASPDLRDSRGESALIRASRAGEAQAVQALLAGGADPSLESKKGETALSAALHAGRYALAEPLADAAERWRQEHAGTMDSSNE
jgi:ankyrin repeat protein